VKLYLTPSEQKTIEELSQAVGKTTKRVVTRSRAVGRNPFEGRSISERTEDMPLLSEDQARRMDLDEVILVIDAQMPIRARRIKYFEDPALQALHAGQSGSFPYPDEDRLKRDREMLETRETVERFARELRDVRAATKTHDLSFGAAKPTSVPKSDEPHERRLTSSTQVRVRAARAAAGGGALGRLSFDLANLGLKEMAKSDLAAAVQTTRTIIEEHA